MTLEITSSSLTGGVIANVEVTVANQVEAEKSTVEQREGSGAGDRGRLAAARW